MLKTAAEIRAIAGAKLPATPSRTIEHHNKARNVKIVGIPVYRKQHVYKGKTYGKTQ
jgi:hypothetical protein